MRVLHLSSVSLALFLALASLPQGKTETAKVSPKPAAAGSQQPNAAAPAAGAQIAASIKEAQIAELGGQDSLADEKYKAALKVAQDSSSNKSIAASAIAANTAMAEFLCRQNKVQEQLSFRQDAVSTAEKTFGKDSTQYAEALANLGSYYGAKGEGAESRRLVDQATAILKNDEAAHPLELACCYLATARRQCAEGTFGLADDSYIKARQLRDSKAIKDDLLALLYCLEHARLLKKIERTGEAKQLQEKIIAFLALNSTASGGVDSSKSGTKAGQSPFAKLVFQAKAAEGEQQWDKALELWKLAAIEVEKPGQEAKLAYALVRLGDQYRLKKEYAQAIAMYKKALDARDKAGATETLGMCRNLERLGQVYMQDQKFADAQAPLTRALEIEKKISADPAIQAPTMQYLMSMYLSHRNNSAAESMAKQLLNLPDTAGSTIALKKQTARASLGGIYMQTGRMQEGMEIMKQMTPPSASVGAELTKAFQSEYVRLEKIFDADEEKSIGII
jgi:tetratricopeptide (TPR) repeat protein